MKSKSLFQYLPDDLEEKIYYMAHASAFKDCLDVIENMISHRVVLRMFNHYEVKRIKYLNEKTVIKRIGWGPSKPSRKEGGYSWKHYLSVGRVLIDNDRMMSKSKGLVIPNMFVQPLETKETGYSNENGLVSIIKVRVCETPRISPLLIPYDDDDDAWGFRGCEEKRRRLNHLVSIHSTYNYFYEKGGWGMNT